MTGAEIVAEARTWLGTRWVHQGRSREGVDCAGLVVKVGQSLGLTDFDTTNYSREASDESMLSLCREYMHSVAPADVQVGDVVVIRFGSNRHMGFVGDYIYGGHTLIHAQTASPRRVIENRLTLDWLKLVNGTVIGYFRLPGVTA